MKQPIRNFLLSAAGLALAATAATAAPWADLERGDLLLGVQASGGQGATTNVFYNLGPAHALRDNPNPGGVIVDLSAELTAAFGADWASRPDLYFGVIANRSKNPASGLGASPPENGDPSRTIYASRGAEGGAGTSLPWTGFTSTALGLAANNHQGQVDKDLPAVNHVSVVANGNEVATITQASHPTPWNNSWSKWNPFLGGGAEGPAFNVFTGGIQVRFALPGEDPGDPATPLAKIVDLYRILGTTGDGTYVTSITLADNGEVSIASADGPAPDYFTVTATAVNGTVVGAGSDISYADGSTARLTAVANAGFGFTGWSGDATGTDNPIDLVMDGNKTVTATFAPFPSVASPTATDIGDTEATLGATVSSDGGSTILERGVVHSVRSANSNPVIGGSAVTKVVVPGTLGVFDTGLTGLAPATTYAYKGYATSAVGTSYTAVAVFTTDTELLIGAGNTATLPNRSILAGDSHGFRFSLATGRQMLITSGGSTNVEAQLLDSSGNVVASKTGTGLISFNELLSAGDYTLRVTNPGGTTQSFSLGLDASAVAAPFPTVSVARGVLNSRNARPVRGVTTVRNVGNLPDRFRVGSRKANRFFRPVYVSGGNITAQITSGNFITPELATGGGAVQINSRVIPNRRSMVQGTGQQRRILRKRFNMLFNAAAVSTGASASASIRVQTR